MRALALAAALIVTGCGSAADTLPPPRDDCRLPVVVVEGGGYLDYGVIRLPSGTYEADPAAKPFAEGAQRSPDGRDYAYTTLTDTGHGQLHVHDMHGGSDRVLLEVPGRMSTSAWDGDGIHVSFASGSRPGIVVDPTLGTYRDDTTGGAQDVRRPTGSFAVLGHDAAGRPVLRDGGRGAGSVFIWDGNGRTVIGHALSPPDFDPAGAAAADGRLWIWTYSGELFWWAPDSGLSKQALSSLPAGVMVIRVVTDCL